MKPQQQSTTVISPPYKKEAGAGEKAGRGKGFGVNEITNTTLFMQRSMNTTTLFVYIMADSLCGTKPPTSSRAKEPHLTATSLLQPLFFGPAERPYIFT